MTDTPELPPLPTLPKHPWRCPLADWEPAEVAAIHGYASAYAAEAVRLARQADAAQPLTPNGRCGYCDDTGDVTSIAGEWRGYCYCPAGKALAAAAPPQADHA